MKTRIFMLAAALCLAGSAPAIAANGSAAAAMLRDAANAAKLRAPIRISNECDGTKRNAMPDCKVDTKKAKAT